MVACGQLARVYETIAVVAVINKATIVYHIVVQLTDATLRLGGVCSDEQPTAGASYYVPTYAAPCGEILAFLLWQPFVEGLATVLTIDALAQGYLLFVADILSDFVAEYLHCSLYLMMIESCISIPVMFFTQLEITNLNLCKVGGCKKNASLDASWIRN